MFFSRDETITLTYHLGIPSCTLFYAVLELLLTGLLVLVRFFVTISINTVLIVVSDDDDNFDDMTLFDVSAEDGGETTSYTHNEDSYGGMSFSDDFGKL